MKLIFALIFLSHCIDLKSHDHEGMMVSEKLVALSEADEMYKDFETFDDFYNSDLPNTVLNTSEALSKYSRFLDYSANEARLKFDHVIQNEFDIFENAYDAGARASTGASYFSDTLTTTGICLFEKNYGCAVSMGSSIVSAVNANYIFHNYFRERDLSDFKTQIENNYATDIEKATHTAKNDATNYWNEINNFIDDSSLSDHKGKARLARDLQRKGVTESNIDSFIDNLEKNRYGNTQQTKKAAKKLLKKAKKFIRSNSRVAEEVSKATQLFQALGGNLSKDAMKAVEIYGGFSTAATRVANQDYLGAALSVVGVFKKKRPDPAQLRFKAIMNALGLLDKKLDRILVNQQTIIKNQFKIMSSLRRIEVGMSEGFDLTYHAIQRKTDDILRAIYSNDDRQLGACNGFSILANAYTAPDSLYIRNLNTFNKYTYSGNTYKRLVNSSVSERLDYLFEKYLDEFQKCDETLSNLLSGIRDNRGIDQYLILKVFKEGQQEERKLNQSNKSYLYYADEFVNNVYLKQYDYYTKSFNNWINTNEITNIEIDKADLSDLYLFEAPIKLLKNNNLDRFKTYKYEDLKSVVELYYGSMPGQNQLRNSIKTPLSITVLKTVAEPINRIHHLYGMFKQDKYIGMSGLKEIEETQAIKGWELLSQAHQLVQLALAQLSIADGRALMPFLMHDSFRDDEETHKNIVTLLENNYQLRTNFLRYLIHQMLTRESRTLREYAFYIDTGNTKVIKAWFNDLANDVYTGNTIPLSFNIRCLNENDKESDKCPEGGSRYYSNIEIQIIYTGKADSYITSWFELPGWQDIMDEKIEIDKSVYDLLILQKKMASEIVTYNFNQELIESLKNNNKEEMSQPLAKLYRLGLINSMGIDHQEFIK
ncbi:hypothetical protein ACFODZ_02955 [Marinicella sediminis]|uniref:Uncharacterized protein n=1 Tax=Marinicella sediminis TaxID=1792834 RepID=A0ABV7J5I3_9GAMM|nr:hypothetical protein [Marinicella sediminis]